MASPDALEPKPDQKFCTKCKIHPKAGGPKDTNPWCLECRAAYLKEYRETLDWRAERRGLIRGIQAMREHIAAHFRQWAGRAFMGGEVSSIIDSLPGPAVSPEQEDPVPAALVPAKA
jgi:hypothetical protein